MSNNDESNLNQLADNQCPYCLKIECKSDYHHNMHCFYCKDFVHSCCTEDCDFINKDFVPKDLKNEFGIEVSADEVKIVRGKQIQIDLGLDILRDTVCNKVVCQSLWAANVWKLAFLQTKNDFEQFKVVNSSFRILGLKADKLDNLVKSGVLNISTSPKDFVRARMEGWEKCHPDSLETVGEVFSEAMKAIFTILQTMGTKQNLKKRKEDELQQKIQERDKQAQQNNNGHNKVGRPKLSKFEKMKAEFKAKYPTAKDEEIIEHLKKMGLTEDTVK